MWRWRGGEGGEREGVRERGGEREGEGERWGGEREGVRERGRRYIRGGAV